jgi:hypothetical protein
VLARFTRLTPHASLALPAAGGAGEPGTPSRVRLTRGRLYRLSCDKPIAVRAGSGQPSSTDLAVFADAPLVFVADVEEMTIAARTSQETKAWVQEEPS